MLRVDNLSDILTQILTAHKIDVYQRHDDDSYSMVVEWRLETKEFILGEQHTMEQLASMFREFQASVKFFNEPRIKELEGEAAVLETKLEAALEKVNELEKFKQGFQIAKELK